MFLKLLEYLGRKRIIRDRTSSQPYLERYQLLFIDRNYFPFNVFLHKFLKSDPDDHHDHPWNYRTLILRGGYWEWTPTFDAAGRKTGEITKWYGAGSFRRAQANSYHRIELDPDITCWTLFMPGPHKKEWGFLTKGKWIQHEEYLKGKQNVYNTN